MIWTVLFCVVPSLFFFLGNEIYSLVKKVIDVYIYIIEPMQSKARFTFSVV